MSKGQNMAKATVTKPVSVACDGNVKKRTTLPIDETGSVTLTYFFLLLCKIKEKRDG